MGISPHADCAQEIGRELEQTFELLSFPFILQHALGPFSPVLEQLLGHSDREEHNI